MSARNSKRRPHIVYFIQVGAGGPIKIGLTVDSTPEKRLAWLQTATPYPLRLLGTHASRDGFTEAQLHARFAHLRIRGEWHAPGDDLLAFIAEHSTPWVDRPCEKVAPAVEPPLPPLPPCAKVEIEPSLAVDTEVAITTLRLLGWTRKRVMRVLRIGISTYRRRARALPGSGRKPKSPRLRSA